ncbi:hypothetical protein A7U60_g1940 [Sanghuangporus baumii]|uniref:DUF7330 domain-containing protein n=1 Tax=Sanghuangporus baumii TaxID=108892 RepID=A0A9Q5I3M8_SANBA|nr:hypothetical protein A7U60_g1940 [Sanghuangporus baumii]
MILLDELDINAKEKDVKWESLPPYSPRRSLRLPLVAAPTRDSTSIHAPSNERLRPRSVPPSVASSTYAQSQSSFTLSSSTSSQTLSVPLLPTPPPSAPLSGPGPSTSRPSSSHSSSFSSLPLSPQATRPPRHLRPSNNVFVKRDAAAITGSFLIDPALQVPECLLPDDPDVLLARNGSGKGKQKRTSLSLVTISGDISVDIWIREGCALHLQKRRQNGNKDPVRGRGDGRSFDGSNNNINSNGTSSHSASGSGNCDSADSAEYWRMDWTSPPPEMPWPDKTAECVDIDIRSETGSIEVRIHARSHQRLRIHATSAHGSVAVGIPRTFAGQIHSNAHTTASTTRSDSASTISSSSFLSTTTLSNNSSAISLPRFRSSSVAYIPSFGFTTSEKEKAASIANEIVGSIVTEFLPPGKAPVTFSSEVGDVVTIVTEHRKSGRGRYLVGDDPTRLISDHLGDRFFDELNLESYTGTLDVFYNDEIPQLRSDNGIITKILPW